jgi:predicted oxidoreductase
MVRQSPAGKYSWQVMNLRIAHREFAISGAEFNGAIRDKKWIKFLYHDLIWQ